MSYQYKMYSDTEQYYSEKPLNGCQVWDSGIEGRYKGKTYRFLARIDFGCEFPYLENEEDGWTEVVFSSSQRKRLAKGVAFGELIQEVLDFEETKQAKENWKWRRIGRESAKKEFYESRAEWDDYPKGEKPENVLPDGNM